MNEHSSRGPIDDRETFDDSLLVEPVSHAEAVAADLVADYDRGTLTPDLEAHFEAHLMECTECQDALEAERSFVRGLRTTAARDAANRDTSGRDTSGRDTSGREEGPAEPSPLPFPPAAPAPGVGWWRLAAIAAMFLLVLSVGFDVLRFSDENERLRERIASLESTTTPGDALGSPLIDVPVTLLTVLRGDSTPSENEIVVGSAPYALAVDIGADPTVRTVSITIVDAEGGARFSASDLVANDLEVVQLTFPAAFLPQGNYVLTARADDDGREIGRYAFRIVERP